MESDLTISTKANLNGITYAERVDELSGDCAKSEISRIPPALNFFLTAVQEFLKIHKEVGREAACFNLDLLENTVRLGWALNDIKRELKIFDGSGGGFETFVENNLPISISQANAFCAEARKFRRDAQDLEFNAKVRQACGLEPNFDLNIFHAPLREQITALPASKFAALMRISGLQKTRISCKMLTGPPRIQEKPAFLKVGAALSRTWTKLNRLGKEIPIEEFDSEERKAVLRDLQPFVELYERLGGKEGY